MTNLLYFVFDVFGVHILQAAGAAVFLFLIVVITKAIVEAVR